MSAPAPGPPAPSAPAPGMPVPVPAAPKEKTSGAHVDGAIIGARYRLFVPELADRPRIVWGLGWREFRRTIRIWWMIILLLATWVITILIPVLILYIMLSSRYIEVDYEAVSQIRFYGLLWPFLMIFAALLGGRLISRDLADRTLHLYLSRPITRADYVTGRLITLLLMLFLVSILPNLILFLAQVTLLDKDPHWYLEHVWVVGAILLHGAFYLLLFSLVALFFSALSEKPYWPVVGIFFTFLMTWLMANIVHSMAEWQQEVDEQRSPFDELEQQPSEADWAYYISLTKNLENVGYPIYGLDSPYGSSFHWAVSLGILLAVMGGCLAAILYRLTTLEVSK